MPNTVVGAVIWLIIIVALVWAFLQVWPRHHQHVRVTPIRDGYTVDRIVREALAEQRRRLAAIKNPTQLDEMRVMWEIGSEILRHSRGLH